MNRRPNLNVKGGFLTKTLIYYKSFLIKGLMLSGRLIEAVIEIFQFEILSFS